MASEEENFDIDIYGDGGEEYPQEETHESKEEIEETKLDRGGDYLSSPETSQGVNILANSVNEQSEGRGESEKANNEVAQKISSTDQTATEAVQLPKLAPQMQGIRRKDGEDDDRYVDPGATTALFVSELHWWVTDDDIRGWANQSQCEDELEEVTFSEHKVNGKSKGQAYVLFRSTQAATAVKQKIETFGEGQHYAKKFTVGFSNPYTNPFKTLPKDGPLRNNASGSINRPHSGSVQQYAGGGFRGNRGGGYNNRGGGMNNPSNYNRGGFQNSMAGFQGSGMGGFPAMGGMQSYGGFQGRGGMMGGIRGGGMGMRGARGAMMSMPMNMGMGGMGLGMGMPHMGGMGMQGTNGFQPNQIQYNPTMFGHSQQSSPGYGSGDNPHGAKRTRQD